MRITVRDLAFDVHLGGPDTGAPVLLLHGFPQHAGEWDLVAPLLHAYGYRTVAPDQRGYSPGARPTDVSAYRIGELVADALAVLAALRIGTAHVVGHGWGALVALHLARRHAHRVRTVTALSLPHTQATFSAARNKPAHPG